LAALTAGGIVRPEGAAGTFELPPGYAEALSRGLGRPESIAAMCQHVAMLGKVEDRITEHFRQGGGVPYDTYEQLWGAGEPYDLDALDPMEVDHVLSLLPGIDERLAAGIDVADVGCGWGAQLNLLARRYPASRFVGFELAEASALRTARLVAERHRLSNVRFQQNDATTLDGAENFDLIVTFDAIHDQVRPDLALRAIVRSLKPGGVYVGVDISGSSTLADNLDDPLVDGLLASDLPTVLVGQKSVYHGHDGLRRWVDTLIESGAAHEVRVRKIRVLDDEHFSALTEVCLEGEMVTPSAMVVRVKDGLIVHVKAYLSDEQTLIRVGVLPPVAR